MNHKLWKKIWKFLGPTRESLFLWFVRREAIPTTKLMWARKFGDSPLCPICCCEEEPCLGCVSTKDLWEKLGNIMAHFYSPTKCITWLEHNLLRLGQRVIQGREWKYVFRTAMYSILSRRNRTLYKVAVTTYQVIFLLNQLGVGWMTYSGSPGVVIVFKFFDLYY